MSHGNGSVVLPLTPKSLTCAFMRRTVMSRVALQASLVVATLLVAPLLAPSSAWAVSPAVQKLTEKGLVKKNSFWLLADETKALETEKTFKDVEKKCRDAQTAFDEAVRVGKMAKEQFDKSKKELEQIKTLLSAGNMKPDQQNRLITENNNRVMLLDKLPSQMVDISVPTENAMFRKIAADLSAARFELLNALLFLQEKEPLFEEKYQALREDEEVSAALKELGNGNRLGPTRNYKKEPAKTTTAEKLVFTDTLPMYRGKMGIVFDAVLNEKTLLPIGDGRANDYMMIPTSVIEGAGQKIAADAQEISLSNGQQTLKCRLAKLDSLRLGKYVLKDVEVIALPPEAVGIPVGIGRKTMADYEVNTEPRDCKVVIKSKVDADKDRDKDKDKKGPSKSVGPVPTIK